MWSINDLRELKEEHYVNVIYMKVSKGAKKNLPYLQTNSGYDMGNQKIYNDRLTVTVRPGLQSK